MSAYKVAGCCRIEGFAMLALNRKWGCSADGWSELRRKVELEPWVPKGDLEDFRRGCHAVRGAMLAVPVAIGDAGWSEFGDAALVGWGGRGCALENRCYFRDYLDHGRTLGRGGLFVATLPSIPVCEAAIALGIHGPVYYAAGKSLDREVGWLFSSGAASKIVVLEIGEKYTDAIAMEPDMPGR